MVLPDEMVPPALVMQVEPTAKQPEEREIPLLKEEEAVADEVMAPVPEMEIPLLEARPAACIPPTKVEVAEEVAVIEPTRALGTEMYLPANPSA